MRSLIICTHQIFFWVMNSRRMRLEHVLYMGKRRDAYRVLVGKSEGKRLLERSRH